MNYQKLDSNYRQKREPESKSQTDDHRLINVVFCKPGIASKRFGLTYIIKELCERVQRAVHFSFVFRNWRDLGLQHAKLHQPSPVLRNYPMVHGPASTINPTVGITIEFGLIADESSTGFYAGLSRQHSNNGKFACIILHRKPDSVTR